MWKRLFITLILTLLVLPVMAQSQTPPPAPTATATDGGNNFSLFPQRPTETPTITPAPTRLPVDPNVAISFPPPVYMLGGEVDIVGTANAARQVSFYLEVQPLGSDLEVDTSPNGIWIPATLGQQVAVVENILGTWDTSTVQDGLYALRLTVNRQVGGPVFAISSPLRVDNNAPALAAVLNTTSALDEDNDINSALLALTATAAANTGGSVPAAPAGGTVTVPTLAPSGGGLAPTPTDFGLGQLTAEVIVVANLRAGDGTMFSIEGGLEPGTALIVRGRSPRNNWLFVQTPGSQLGWVAPSVVTLDTPIGTIPIVNPPPRPVVPTATPLPSPIPADDLPDGVITAVELDRSPVEGEAFQIIVSIANQGVSVLPSNFLFCNAEPMNAEVATRINNLEAGASDRIALPLRLDEGGGDDIAVICKIDMNDSITETDETNNINRVDTRLGGGD